MTGSVKDVRRAARASLASVFTDSSPTVLGLEVDALLAEAIGVQSDSLVVHSQTLLSSEQLAWFTAAIDRRRQCEPIAYIIGRKEFYGREFECNPTTLIPRPDTEILVEAVLEKGKLGKIFPRLFLDVGCGTGCIGLTLAAEFLNKGWQGRALLSDYSPAALLLAKRNAKRLGLEHSVDLVCANLLDGIAEIPSLVLSNPPYIPDQERLMPDVERFEPRSALRGGVDGLDLVYRLIADWHHRAPASGLLYLEIGDWQHDAVESFALGRGLAKIVFFQDLSSAYRIVEIER